MIEKKLTQLPLCQKEEKIVGFTEKITDLLGEQHKQWQPGDIVFLSADTGMGKTYWYLWHLYQYARNESMQIAVLVNRRFLKAQLIEEVKRYDRQQGNYQIMLHIFSYQEVETDGERAQKIQRTLRNCHYIVCDEAHYFCSDAVFNPKTQKSFEFITGLYRNTVLVFISATMGIVRPFIEEQITSLYNEAYENWEGNVIDKCLYDEDGERRSFSKYLKRYDRYESAFEDMNQCQHMGGPTIPRVMEYTFMRDTSSNVDAKYFRKLDDMVAVIEEGTYDGKWMVFVSSKRAGKDMRDKLLVCGKKVAYIDADYDSFVKWDERQKEAYTEVENIRKYGMFNSDILITTAVLDNGISIRDSKVKNIILLTDDEVGFKQMLGRRRLLFVEEKLNVFISFGKANEFKERADNYSDIYWKLCNRRNISLMDAYCELRNNYRETEHLLSFYDFNGINHHSHGLTIEAVRMRSLYCEMIAGGLLSDSTFFLKEQMRWLGKDCTQEWLESSSVLLPQSEINAISGCLDLLYHREGVIDKREFEKVEKKIIDTAAKIDPQKYKGKQGNINTVNSALRMRKEWRKYQITAVGDRKTFYEICADGKARYDIHADFTLEALKIIVEENTPGDMEEIWKRMFELEIPKCLTGDSESLKVYINGKLKKYQGLEGWILRSSGKGDGKKIVVGKRPNSSIE